MNTEKILNNISQDILFVISSEGEIENLNARAKQEFSQSRLDNIFQKEELKVIKENISECLATQEDKHFIFLYHSKYYQVVMHPFDNKIAVSMQNITESQNLKHTLSEMMQKLNFASKTAKIGYWELDLVAKEISWSSEMFRIFGIDEKEISSKKNIIREQMHKDDLPHYKDNLRQIIKTGKTKEGFVRIIRPSGNIIYCRYMAEYIAYNRYNRKIVGTFQDLTDLLEIQHALEASKETAERLNQEKSYFLAQASHDLQQPVSAIGLFIHNLLNADLTGKQQILVGKIYDSAQALHHLLNNLLDISNLDAKGVNINKKEFDLYDVIKRIKKEIKYKLQNKDIRFKVVNCHQKIKSDEFLVERILRNFISNAIKYTKNKILVGCLKYQNKIRIMVLDNGIGIDEKEISLIFTPYYQSPNIQDNRSKGSGLGLAIAKKTANALEAEVGVKSEIGKGSNFYIDINLDI